jgi:DNA-binding MarR family transcriptional regulator
MATTKAVPAMAEAVGAVYAAMGRGEVELNALRVLFVIASHHGKVIPQGTVRDLTGLSEAAISRNLAILGEGASRKQDGPEWVESYEDPEYRRRKLVKLTPKGRQFLESLQFIFDKHTGR